MNPLTVTYLMAALAGFLTALTVVSVAVAACAVAAFVRINKRLAEAQRQPRKPNE